MFSINKNSAANSTQSASKKSATPTIIASDMNILGNLISDGLIDIDGTVEGNTKAEQVTIRSNGKIKGDVQATSVHVYGEIKGLIKAKNVHLYASCRVEGIIMHESLSIEDGAFVDGKFKRTDKMTTMEEENEQDMVETQVGSLKVLENLRLIGS